MSTADSSGATSSSPPASTSSFNKSERPPLLKKTKTLTATESAPSTPLFRAPLFPTVRLTSSSSSTTRLSPPSDPLDPFASPSSSSSFSDCDYLFPSFLGPHPSRATNRSDFNSSFGSGKKSIRGLGLDGEHSKLVDSLQGIKKASKVVTDQDLQVTFAASTTSLQSRTDSSRGGCDGSNKIIRESKRSLGFYLLTFTCILSLSYAIYLQSRVTELQDEITFLHTTCSSKFDPDDNAENFQLVDSSLYFESADNRTVALYIVLVTLIMPFIVYKYLDYLPQIKNFSNRKRNNREEVPLKKRIAYMVDVCFSVYPYAKLLALLFATVFLIVFGGLALYAVNDGSFSEALWRSWTFIADSGNHADSVGTGPRIVSVSISSGGMLIFAMMLGLVSDAISEKVDSLRKGKSEVIERNHILILGWSDKLGSLLKQLAVANKSIGGGVIVVLAERDKEEMEMDIAKLEFDFMGTSVICRSGSPLILADLKKVSVSKARAVIVLASDENADQSDARALRVVLSLTGVKEGLRGHVVVEMSDLDNEPLVKLVGGELIETVVAHDVIGRLMIQCALQPGLAQIWEDILGFENAEFYIKRWPQLDGIPFKDVLISFPDAIPCGVKVAADGGKIILNPDDNYILKAGDEVLVIAEDDDTYAPGLLPEVRRVPFPNIINPPKFPEKILFCGWRRDIDDMILVLEALLAEGSELWMFNEVPLEEREQKLSGGELDLNQLRNIKLVHCVGNAVIRRNLEGLPLETFDSILILADESVEDSIVHSDSRSLATLLLIRDIQSKRLPRKDTKSSTLRQSGFSHSSWIREMQQASDKSIIISEILDSRTRNLVSVSRISDYVLSNELVSMALAMVAEDKQINRVLEELFGEEGNEICIRPAEFYLFDGEELCFFELMIRGRQRDEVLIGYRLADTERAIINPPDKSSRRKWSLEDVFVVIAIDE